MRGTERIGCLFEGRWGLQRCRTSLACTLSYLSRWVKHGRLCCRHPGTLNGLDRIYFLLLVTAQSHSIHLAVPFWIDPLQSTNYSMCSPSSAFLFSIPFSWSASYLLYARDFNVATALLCSMDSFWHGSSSTSVPYLLSNHNMEHNYLTRHWPCSSCMFRSVPSNPRWAYQQPAPNTCWSAVSPLGVRYCFIFVCRND